MEHSEISLEHLLEGTARGEFSVLLVGRVRVFGWYGICICVVYLALYLVSFRVQLPLKAVMTSRTNIDLDISKISSFLLRWDHSSSHGSTSTIRRRILLWTVLDKQSKAKC